MLNLAEITTIVRAYLGDDTAVVKQPILDSVNFLSNIFNVDSTDTAQSTAVDGTTLNLPTDYLKIDSVFIDGSEILPLVDLNDLDYFIVNGEQRWYEFGGKIQFTKAFTSILTTKIFFRKGFKEPETAIVTDVPERYMELVYLGAQFRYYNLLLAQVATKRQELPDVKPNELRGIRDDIKKTYFDLIKMIKQDGQSL